jgi:hypothetical protein
MVSTAKNDRKDFRTEGVVVDYPSQVEVLRLPLPKKASMPRKKGGFQLLRPVINLEVVDAAKLNKKVKKFDPPIYIFVRYTARDLAWANGKSLSLGFWNGKKWIRFTHKKHLFSLIPKPSMKYEGWGVVRVKKWDDPTIAWGK